MHTHHIKRLCILAKHLISTVFIGYYYMVTKGNRYWVLMLVEDLIGEAKIKV